MHRSRTIHLGDIAVAADDWPADVGLHTVPLLFLHGAVQTRRIWDAQIVSLVGTRRIVAADLRGHGETLLGLRPMSVKQMAADALNLLDALEIRNAVVCGVSLGGMVALQLAEQAPERVSSLILSNTPTSLTSNRWLRSLVDRIDPQNLMPITFRLLGQKRAAKLGLAVAAKAVGPRWVGPTARRHFIEGFERMDPQGDRRDLPGHRRGTPCRSRLHPLSGSPYQGRRRCPVHQCADERTGRAVKPSYD